MEKILIFLLLTVSPILSAPVKDSSVGYVKVTEDDVHRHVIADREPKWNFNYNPGNINIQTVTGGGELKIGHHSNIEIEESSSKLPASATKGIKDCKYRYREVPSDCICRKIISILDPYEVCATNQLCSYNSGCYDVCKPDSKIKTTDYYSKCYCKNEDSGDLSISHCAAGNMCTSDGECHYAYEVSGVATTAISARSNHELWTNALYRIKEMPEELINSILFRPEEFVRESTIQLSSPKNATVYLALDEKNDGGLKKQLETQGWTMKASHDDQNVWYVEYHIPEVPQTSGNLTIWSNEIFINIDQYQSTNQPIELKINEDGAKFVIMFSTDCENEFVNGICFCKRTDSSKGARHCLTGQGCKEGSCYDNVQLFPGK